MKKKKVLFVAAEVDPFFKTGGLGDVTKALPKALNEQDCDCRVIMPLYNKINDIYKDSMQYLGYLYVDLNWRHQYCGVFKLCLDNTIFYFLDNKFYYNRDEVYDDFEMEKFCFLDVAALEVAKYVNFKPDIIHIHDWHTGPIAALMNDKYYFDPFYKNTKVVFTIHNIAYQGKFNKDAVLDVLPLNKDKYYDTETINFLALGIQYSYKVTTVSPTYAKEILTSDYGEGLEGLLSHESNKLCGILNGIDLDSYDPKNDKFLAYNFEPSNYKEGKRKNKEALLNELGFSKDRIDKPLISVVSRLASQKGMDLLLHILHSLLDEDVTVVVLGSGLRNLEDSFRYFNEIRSENFRAIITFNNGLSHRIYASSDMFLMPSRFEPCGLAQMIALRYGTIPIVRETGGLKDSIASYNEYTLEGNGFSFSYFNEHDFYNSILYALSIYDRKEHWNKVIENGFNSNFSWNESAKKYIVLYNELNNNK